MTESRLTNIGEQMAVAERLSYCCTFSFRAVICHCCNLCFRFNFLIFALEVASVDSDVDGVFVVDDDDLFVDLEPGFGWTVIAESCLGCVW